MNSNANMGQSLSSAQLYTDFAGLTELRAKAAQDSSAASAEVAKQFEALFLQSMLAAMRQASQIGDSTDSEQTQFYQSMFDKQIAIDLANGQGIGLAAVLQKELGGVAAVPAEDKEVSLFLVPDRRMSVTPLIPTPDNDNPFVNDVVKPATPETMADKPVADWRPESPEQFIRDLWPQASKVAERLGVPPEVLIAQSALETGWGKKMIRNADGSNSFNLFGIKADARWQGDHANVSTLEYRDGIAQREQAAFRSYPSLQASMDDYVDFLQQSPRYQQALANASDGQTFLKELHKAGYATDPAYVEKISSIMQRDYFHSMSQSASDQKLAAVTQKTQG